ncbi:MBL fold metallo-hydrolase [Methanolapillus millepedarum]|uniref:Ribonuclease BN n=1 Tax=Methanolapillus millepedarum TaxID=3028296 RepID=A0AA96VC26_9EURY|nr:Ribonuclease BN [Methanosarcinaceae archaeon Ac7]
MKITLLGTGDAPGTPTIGCNCPSCTDAKLPGSKSCRTRFSVLVQTDFGNVLIDTSPDMREQLLRENVPHIDAVIWTHGHYDHYGGFAEFYRVQKEVSVYGVKDTVDYITNIYFYITADKHYMNLYEPFSLIGLEFSLFEVKHFPEKLPVGVVISDGKHKIIISGDCELDIPQESIDYIQNPDLFIVDAIVPEHMAVNKHMNSTQAFEMAEKIGAKKVVFTHLSHFYGPHDGECERYPLGFDGMGFEF